MFVDEASAIAESGGSGGSGSSSSGTDTFDSSGADAGGDVGCRATTQECVRTSRCDVDRRSCGSNGRCGGRCQRRSSF